MNMDLTRNNELKIAVLGLGHVGLPTALGLAEIGWHVSGVDHDRPKAARIAGGESPFYEPGIGEMLKKHLDTGRFVVVEAPDDAIRNANVLFVCVPTPQRGDGSADLVHLDHVSRAIASNLNDYKLVVEKSTAPVQTARKIQENIIRYLGGGPAPEFEVAVNPEFLREGTAIKDFLNPDRIVLGVASQQAKEMLLEIYRPLLHRMGATVESTVIVTDTDTSEIIKHASNALLATKISVANMVADLCEETGSNIEDVARGVGMDARLGPFLRPGVGYGGSCLPKDIRAFSWIAAQHGVDFSLLAEVEKINLRRVDRFISLVQKALWVVKGKTLAVWGLSFKPGTDDVREAPSVPIVQRLLEEGARLRLYDPRAMNEFMCHFPGDTENITYCETPQDAAEGADGLLVLTEWSEFAEADLEGLRQRMAMPLIVDGRNVFQPAVAREAGFEYHSVGRP